MKPGNSVNKSQWARMGEAGHFAGLKFLAMVYRYLGYWAFKACMFPVIVYFFARKAEARAASRQFLQQVRHQYPDSLPGGSLAWQSFRHFLSFGDCLFYKLVGWTKPMPIDSVLAENEGLLAEIADGQHGCLVIGSHFGNLEYSRSIAHRHWNLVVNALLYDEHAQNFARLMKQEQPDSRINLLQVTDLDLDLALRLKEMIKRGEWVVIAGDRVPVTAGSRHGTAEFFGQAARFPVGPYVLASVLQCPVYLLHCFKQDRKFVLNIEPFKDRIDLPRSGREDFFQAMVQAYASALESQVARAPLQWFNFYDFWAQS